MKNYDYNINDGGIRRPIAGSGEVSCPVIIYGRVATYGGGGVRSFWMHARVGGVNILSGSGCEQYGNCILQQGQWHIIALHEE